VKEAFSRDEFELAQQATTELKSLVSNIEMGLLKGEAHLFWMEALKEINHGIEGILFAKDIEAARRSFEKLSTGLINSAETVGLAGESSIYVYHCPMAFKGKGADWIQNKTGTENPYYGSRMFTCGDVVREIEVRESPVSSSESDQSSAEDQHNH
jgi:Cu(I)/Ag(I) efflux system membrane fusion protein